MKFSDLKAEVGRRHRWNNLSWRAILLSLQHRLGVQLGRLRSVHRRLLLLLLLLNLHRRVMLVRRRQLLLALVGRRRLRELVMPGRCMLRMCSGRAIASTGELHAGRKSHGSVWIKLNGTRRINLLHPDSSLIS